MKKIFLASVVWLAFAATSFAQNGSNYWERLDKTHPVTTVESIVNATPSAPSAEGFRLSMVYDGQFRKLSSENLELMQAIGMEKKDLKAYKYELLFKYNSQEFWLPVQTDLIEQLQLELRKNEPVLLYTTVLQTPTQQDKAKKALLVEDFKVD
ncbi:hypothetical protein [Rufibacter roseus]|uniref:Uncharacterized protein n=1 Tax=Rufibacter roseus TaxID=1567108 RepID=A0ABW2DNF4_9BACT|nr:hypothetical protein [Rufibacter roseus]